MKPQLASCGTTILFTARHIELDLEKGSRNIKVRNNHFEGREEWIARHNLMQTDLQRLQAPPLPSQCEVDRRRLNTVVYAGQMPVGVLKSNQQDKIKQ